MKRELVERRRRSSLHACVQWHHADTRRRDVASCSCNLLNGHCDKLYCLSECAVRGNCKMQHPMKLTGRNSFRLLYSLTLTRSLALYHHTITTITYTATTLLLYFTLLALRFTTVIFISSSVIFYSRFTSYI